MEVSIKVNAQVRFYTRFDEWLCFKHAAVMQVAGVEVNHEIGVFYEGWCPCCLIESEEELMEYVKDQLEVLEEERLQWENARLEVEIREWELKIQHHDFATMTPDQFIAKYGEEAFEFEKERSERKARAQLRIKQQQEERVRAHKERQEIIDKMTLRELIAAFGEDEADRIYCQRWADGLNRLMRPNSIFDPRFENRKTTQKEYAERMTEEQF